MPEIPLRAIKITTSPQHAISTLFVQITVLLYSLVVDIFLWIAFWTESKIRPFF